MHITSVKLHLSDWFYFLFLSFFLHHSIFYMWKLRDIFLLFTLRLSLSLFFNFQHFNSKTGGRSSFISSISNHRTRCWYCTSIALPSMAVVMVFALPYRKPFTSKLVLGMVLLSVRIFFLVFLISSSL